MLALPGRFPLSALGQEEGNELLRRCYSAADSFFAMPEVLDERFNIGISLRSPSGQREPEHMLPGLTNVSHNFLLPQES